MSDSKLTYHEVDFLLPSQRFRIQFSYISHKRLPFYREFALRVIHIAPISKAQLASYFGLSKREVDELVSDLVERGELTLSTTGRLTLTAKSMEYFSELAESPQILDIQDSAALLSYDLATFSCLGSSELNDKWKAGIPLEVDHVNSSQSEALVEKYFQHQFNQLAEKGFLSKAVSQEGTERPTIYTVNSVNKIRSLPLRLKTEFKLDNNGRAVEREDFDQLRNSEVVHELMTIALSQLARPNNFMSIAKAMVQLGDEHTSKVVDSNNGSINPRYLEDLNKIEQNNGLARTTFLGPIYSPGNWKLLQKHLAPILTKRVASKSDYNNSEFIWIAPSDPFWSKTERFTASFSDLLRKASTKAKTLYAPTLYVPVADAEDRRSLQNWRNQLDPNCKQVSGLIEGFLDGNAEVLFLEGELVVVIYHLAVPELLPVTLPIGFISTDKAVVERIGSFAMNYVRGSSSFDKPNCVGPI